MPEWLQEKDNYIPLKGNSTFAIKTMKKLGAMMARLKIQRGIEKGKTLPALVRLLVVILAVLLLSLTRNLLVFLAFAAAVELLLAMKPADLILSVLKGAFAAALLTLVIFLPAMILRPEGMANNLLVVGKVFLSVELISLFNHTTQWNHISDALRRLHVPGVFVFTLDITVKYIVLLGSLIIELLTALQLRSIGRNSRKYQSVGGVMGVTVVRSAKMSRQMYEAMECRGFTDEYKGL